MENAFRQPNIADVFEKILVPGIFERYARDLVERARPIGPSARILDLGCGTGIVARVLRERLGGAAKISGLDASPPMVEKARSLAPELDFREGNAMALPFEDRAFDLVLSQQMLQFVPDAGAALREVRRVLAPGGRLLASTWRPRSEQPLHDALGKVAERHLGNSNDRRWSLDGDALRALLVEAGFVGVEVTTVTLTEQFREFPLRMSAMAAGFDLSSLSEAERERKLVAVETESTQVMNRFAADGGGFAAPSTTNVATAIAA
jgi:ubiquinone/menaquinone biosynthesis C-methylase UbiE